MLDNVTTRLSDIQKRLLEIITPHTILVGHSLNSDLTALKITHPFIVDTSIIYPHPRGPPLKSSLKWLCQRYLSREIQNHDSNGHDSVEDARACLDLVKQKCEKGPMWGTSDASSESIFKRLGRSPKPKFLKTHADTEEFRIGAVVDWGDPSRGHGAHADVCIGCETDAEVVEGIKGTVKGSVNGEGSPVGGVDFVWGRLRELEAVRGWWSRSKTEDNAELRANAMKTLSQSDENSDGGEASGTALGQAVAKTVSHIVDVFQSLPACTAFMVYSGTGDMRETARLQAIQQQFRREYSVKKWDEISVKWTDTEEQALRKACRIARDGLGFVVVK
jgi:RNA exonuclease 1